MTEALAIDELIGHEGGVWRVLSQRSVYILDLDAGTVIHFSGPGRQSSHNVIARPLRTVDACRVGDGGRWTTLSDDITIDFYWHFTSRIRRIDQVVEVPYQDPYCEDATDEV